jgi:ribosomal protein L10
MIMTNTPIVTIFYNLGSANCKALLQFIKNTNTTDNLPIKFINVDNNAMKNIVTEKFSVLPSMVVILNEEISLYTGDNVFEWFHVWIASAKQAEEEAVSAKQTEEAASARLEEATADKEVTSKPKTVMEIASELSKARENLYGY